MTNNELESIVISSRIRLARNFSDIVFPNKIKSKSESDSVISRTFEVLKNFENYRVSELDKNSLLSLKEKHLISEDLAKNTEFGALCLTHDEDICVMINEEEHLREQCILKGFNLQNALNKLNEIDDILLENLPISYSHELGFLTTCPSNLGTGMRASVMMFLPALCITNNINKLAENLNKIGLTIRGEYGENSSSNGFVFQISNAQTLGITEQEIIEKVNEEVIKIAEKEISARNYILENKYTEIKDIVMRSYGTLKYAYKLSSKEATKFLSQLKFGICLNMIDCVKIEMVNNLLENCLDNSLLLINGENIDFNELEFFRAQYISNKI